MEAELVQRAGMPYVTIPAGQIAGMGWRTLPNMVKVVQGTLASRRILNDFKPDVLLFTGGFVAVPMALAGRKIPSLVYVPDIEPGMALKILARFANSIALTTEESSHYFPARSKTVVTGYPTRPELAGWTREKAQAHLGLSPDHFTLLVTGGSKGSRTINQPLLAILPQLLTEMQVIHITGKLDWAEIEAARGKIFAELPSDVAGRYHPMPYLHEMGAALAAADLAVSRSGASTLGEYPMFGLPAVLVPYQFAWRYQKVNANHLVKSGAAVVLEHNELIEKLLPTLWDLSRNPERLQRMRQSMQSLAHPQAAASLADQVRDLWKHARSREK
jgi:UDP-N-acetylglucosamine--N-acetylmuramyl-(pentapeptide) pyrophosphoryl-undecaprenol N-acetylglucosamine transferase